MRAARRSAPGPGWRPVAFSTCVLALLTALAGCGAPGSSGHTSLHDAIAANSPGPPTASAPSSKPIQATTSTSSVPSAASQAVAVSDGTGQFLVQASSLSALPYVIVHTYFWSSAPHQDFLVDTLTITNQSATDTEELTDFDDLSSGLSDDVSFVMNAAEADESGYAADCGVDPAFPPSLCPITYPQGLRVDSDSANHNDRSVVSLSPKSSAQVELSYGPVSADIQPSTISVYFNAGQALPAAGSAVLLLPAGA
jgi:hypothetical protein